VRLIDVDVLVTDREGRFVRNLTRDDFELLEDGKPQTLATFSFVDLPVGTPGRAASAAGDEPETDIVTNRDTAPEGRVYVMLLDAPSTVGPGGTREGITYDAYVKQFSRQFLDEAIGPGDLVAVVHAQGTFTDSIGFTTSRQLVLKAVDRYGLGWSGAGEWDELPGPERVARNLNTYRAIQDLSERLGAMSGRRKAILWLGGQVAFDPVNAPCPKLHDPLNLCAIPRSASGIMDAYRDAIGAATRNNVAIYPIDPSGLTTTLGRAELDRTAALRVVAEDTGGLAVVGTNNFASGYQAIMRDTSAYYVLGYTPASAYRDGKFHSIQVRVKREGLSVRARKGYYAPAPGARPPTAPPPPDGVSAAARDALRMPVSTRGLMIDLFSAPFKGSGRDASVVVGGQITGDLRLDAADRVALSYQVFTLEGQVRTGEYKVFTLMLEPETRGRVADAGLRFVDRLSLPPGRYELRLVADQPGGSVGSVVTHLEVPAFDDVLALSGVLLSSSSAADDLTLREDQDLRATLGSDPTAVRRFTQGDVLTAFTEVYARDTRTSDADISVTATLKAASGTDVKRESASLARRESSGSDAASRWGATIELSLTDVPPGRYVLSVDASSGREERTAQRRIPLVVEE
jgi:VWFA-related protein